MGPSDLPSGIADILEVYEKYVEFLECKSLLVHSTQKWLMGIGFLGILRYKNKTDSPYFTDKEIKSYGKSFIRNLKIIYNLVKGKYFMVDEKDVGIALFDCESNPEKEITIEK